MKRRSDWRFVEDWLATVLIISEVTENTHEIVFSRGLHTPLSYDWKGIYKPHNHNGVHLKVGDTVLVKKFVNRLNGKKFFALERALLAKDVIKKPISHWLFNNFKY